MVVSRSFSSITFVTVSFLLPGDESTRDVMDGLIFSAADARSSPAEWTIEVSDVIDEDVECVLDVDVVFSAAE